MIPLSVILLFQERSKISSPVQVARSSSIIILLPLKLKFLRC
jgi:hypothetical protein